MDKKVYSVKEVAEITGFTTRTIRNYIKNGQLAGSKFGNHWRFTDEDIAELEHVSGKRCKFQKIQFEFLDQLNSCNVTTPHSCYICCYPRKKVKDINALRKEILDQIKDAGKVKSDFFYHYSNKKNQAEFILLGSNEQVKLMNEIILSHIDKN